jgi:hypothetical protein
MASGSPSRSKVASHVVLPRLFRSGGHSAGVASLSHTNRATAGSAKAKGVCHCCRFLHNPSLKRTRLRLAA